MQAVEQRDDARMVHVFLGDDELVGLFGQRDEVEAERVGGGFYAERRVGEACVDAVRRLHVRRAYLRIALYLLRGLSVLPEQVVEEDARPRAGLAVRENHVLFAEVREVMDSLRIAARDDDSLRPVEYEDAVPFSAVREALYENVVVAAGRFVEQMRRSEVAFAARERR